MEPIFLETVIDTVDNCRYCLMCRHVAPVGHYTRKETLTPHGLALLVASQRRGLIDYSPEFVQAMYSAADGGNTRAHCVTDQPLPEALAAVRAELVAQKLAPAAVYAVDEALARWQTPFAEQRPDPAAGAGDTALFVGDEAPYLWPALLPAARSLLAAVGLEPVSVAQGRSSGFMASSLGLSETAVRLASANLAEIAAAGARRLLVLAPGDAFTLYQLYPERLDLRLPAGVRVEEVLSVLALALQQGTIRFRQAADTRPYAYLDPTHAVRVPARHDAPRQLLAATMPTAARELFWRRERAHPVGSTAVQFGQPAVAELLTRARLDDAVQAGAELLFCEDAGTLAQVSRYAAEYGLEVRGLYEWLAAHLEN